MAIEKRSTTKGITYRAIVTQRIDEQRHRITKTFNTKRDAKSWENEQVANLKAGLNVADMTLGFDMLASRWLNDVVQHEKSPATYRAFKGDMSTHLLPTLSKYKISKIAKNHVTVIRTRLSEKKLAKASINRIMATFKSFINYCIDHGHIIKNPFVGYKELRIQKKQKEFWEINDLKNFVENAKGDFYYDVYLFALNTGVRIGEIGALNVGKINFDRASILIDESIGRGGLSTVKNYEIRNVYMNTIVKDIVKRNMKGKKATDPLFQTIENARIYSSGFTSRYFGPLQKKLDISSSITFHGLRHTFASHFLMNGGSIFDLQKLLGHKSINSTMVYAHLSQSHIKDIMEKIRFG